MNVLDNYKEDLLNLGDPQEIDEDTHYCKFNYNYMPFMVKTNKICHIKSIKKNKDNHINISITSRDYLVWFESLYKWCIQTIHERSEDWFGEEFSLSEVENTFINPLKSNIKETCFDIQCTTDENRLHIVDTKDNVNALESLYACNIIPTFHIKGINFNSNHFTFDIEVNNILVILEEQDEPESVQMSSAEQGKEIKEMKEKQKTELPNLSLEKDDDLAEVSISTENLEEMSMDIESSGFYKIYELLDEKIKDNIIENLQKIFNKKKIKLNLELMDIFDEEE
jgi:hypothetical protein